MKMSELKVGMFCVIKEFGADFYCVVLPSPNDTSPSFASLSGYAFGDIENDGDRELILVFTPNSNYGLNKALTFDGIPTVEFVQEAGFNLLYVKDDKASKIQARIDTLHSELNQLTEELNSL